MFLLILSLIIAALGIYAYAKALIIINDVEQLLQELKDNNHI